MTMINRVLRRARGFLPASASEARALRAQVDELRADINELRADNLRIAALHDAVVDRLAATSDHTEN